MKKGWYALIAAAVFAAAMLIIDGGAALMAIGACIGGFLLNGSQGLESAYTFLTEHLNFYSLLIYLVLLVPFLLWYILVFVRGGKPGRRGQKAGFSRLRPKSVFWLVLLTFGVQGFVNILVAIIGVVLPKSLENYTNLIESSGVTTYSLIWVFSTLILPPLAEEIIFRGLIMGYLRRAGVHWLLANLLQAVCFGIYHQNLVQGIYAAALGFILGYLVYRYGSLTASITVHFLFNLFGTVLADLESRFLPENVQTVLVLLGIPIMIISLVKIHLDTRR